VRGASALNQLLSAFPNARIRVQIVWEPVLKTDLATPLTQVLALLPDRRVVQYWDPGRVLSADLVRAVNEQPGRFGRDEALPPRFIAWDVVAVFGGAADWDRSLPVPAYYGGPVVDVIDATRDAIRQQVAEASAQGK
jgi:hypothetical protein